MSEQRRKMYEEACSKYGTEKMAGLVAFGRKEARPASAEEIETYEVILDGERAGETMVVATLDADVIERNLRWIRSVYVGNVRYIETEKPAIRVDKENRTITITTRQETAP